MDIYLNVSIEEWIGALYEKLRGRADWLEPARQKEQHVQVWKTRSSLEVFKLILAF